MKKVVLILTMIGCVASLDAMSEQARNMYRSGTAKAQRAYEYGKDKASALGERAKKFAKDNPKTAAGVGTVAAVAGAAGVAYLYNKNKVAAPLAPLQQLKEDLKMAKAATKMAREELQSAEREYSNKLLRGPNVPTVEEKEQIIARLDRAQAELDNLVAREAQLENLLLDAQEEADSGEL